MQKRERTCSCCGEIEFTFSQADQCSDCWWGNKRASAAVEERKKLESIGYTDIEGPSICGPTPHRSWTFTHECGTRQTWRFGNILKQLNLRPNAVPCKTCGGKERMSVAMTAFIKKYGIKDIELWGRYSKKVRSLTEATYKKYKAEINPLNLKRGMRTFHLDHRIPIIQGFVSGLPPEVLAARENLQILPAFDNISKGRK